MRARKQCSVRFGAVTTIVEDESNSSSSSSSSSSHEERWVPEAQLQKLFAKELSSAEQEYALTKKINLDWRGLEYHFSINAKRPKFAKLYVKAVVQKSLALRSAAFLGTNKKRGGVTNVEQSLQRYAGQHARATAIIAREVAKHDEQEARRLNGSNSDNSKAQEKSATLSSPRTPSRTTRTRPSLIPRTVSREGVSMMVIPV